MISKIDRTRWLPLAIAGSYAIVSAAWIFISDTALWWMAGDLPAYSTFGILKGWAFIGVSAALLYFVLRSSGRKIHQSDSILEVASDLALMGGWRTDLSTGKTAATSGVYAIYAMKSGPFDNSLALSCHRPTDSEILVAETKASTQDHQPRTQVFCITALDGTAKSVRFTIRPEIGSNGKVRAIVGAMQDITASVALGQEAEVQALRARSSLDNMPDIFFLFDRNLRFTFANTAGLNLFHLENGPDEECLGKTLWEGLPQVESQLREPVTRMLKDGQPFSRLVENTRTHRTSWINAFVTPDGIGAHVRNVTEEIKARGDLSASVERYRLASMASQDVLFDWDAVQDTMVWSDAAFERYGYQPAVFPRTLDDVLSRIHPGDRERVSASAMDDLLLGGPEKWTAKYRLLCADDRVAHVFERGMILRDTEGRALRVVGTITDITTWHEDEQRLHAIIDVAADAIFEYDPKNQIVVNSEGIKTNFGHDWVGENNSAMLWVNAVHSDDRSNVVASYNAFCEGRDTRWRCEYRMARGDGSIANVRERATAVRDEDGKLLRVIGSMEDVTLERRAEERIKMSERMQAVGTLTGGVAHDFNNLLTIILGNADLLHADPRLDKRTRDLAAAILKAAERGAELTASLLAFSGKQPLAVQVVDSRAALAELAQLLERTLPATVTLDINTTKDVWLIAADPSQMNAAILNLVVNARDAMPNGGRVVIDCVNVTLDGTSAVVGLEAQVGDFVRITVADSGIGMDPDVVARAVEPFFTTKPPGSGTGLGLSIVYGFVQESGGHMNISTVLGEGTAISLYLPRSRGDKAAARTQLTVAAMTGQNEHVLIVEDNLILLPHVTEMVSRLGYRVSIAPDARAALVILNGVDTVDVLFTDIVLGGDCNGTELSKRALDAQPGLRVLFTSGYTENATIDHGHPDRDVHLLAKPYRKSQLAMKLRHVIEETLPVRVSAIIADRKKRPL